MTREVAGGGEVKSDRGGLVNQAGIRFQNCVAVARVASMLAGADIINPRLGTVTSVRSEAPSHVDDVVVTYSTARTEYIQAKLNVAPGEKAWAMMWKHFYDQYRSRGFRKGPSGHLLTLAVGSSPKMKQLQEMLRRASEEAESYDEWCAKLNEEHQALLRGIIDGLAKHDVQLRKGVLFDLCRHVRVQISDNAGLQDEQNIRNQVHETLKGTFENPEEAFNVLMSLVGERTGRTLTADGLQPELRNNDLRRVSDGERNRGEYVYLMCDRTPQAQQLDTTLMFGPNDEGSPSPRVFMIYGPVGQNHNSLIVRFYHTVIRGHFEDEQNRAGVRPFFVEVDGEWPCMGDPRWDTNFLYSQLFESFGVKVKGMRPEQLTADAFRRHLLARGADFVVIRHHITEWREETPEVINNYLKFWGGVKGGGAIPPCLIFLNVVHPNDDSSRQVIAEVERMSELPACASAGPLDCFCIRLEPLKDVTRAQVENWFHDHKIVGPGIDPLQKCDELFGPAPGRGPQGKPMMYVEPKLKEIYKQFIGA